MRLNTDGLVIREQNIGEADRRVILLPAIMASCMPLHAARGGLRATP